MSNNFFIIEDTGGNFSFSPFSSNINNKSLFYIYWNDIINKPSFSNICFTSSYNDLSNLPVLSLISTSGNYNDLINKSYNNNNNNNIYTFSNVGIGTNNPSYKLDIFGDINFTGSLNQNNNKFKTSQWNNLNLNIFYNIGNVGIGKNNNIEEKLDIEGNIRINGNIYPSINSNFDLGLSNYKWKDLYLSGNSIYLDNIIISNENNNISIKDSNNNYKNLNVNELILNSNNYNYKFKINENGILTYDSNNKSYYPSFINNNNDYSNIVYLNVLLSTSNELNNKIINLNTDTVKIGIKNRFIVNDIYDRNIIFTKDLNTSNLITSNINVIGNKILINTNIYQTEKIEINNNKNNICLKINQLNNNYNLIEFYNNNKLIFIINSNNYIGINNINPIYDIDINSNLNSSEIYIKNINISNIINNNIINNSNKLINYNNLINKPILSTISLSRDYNDLSNLSWMNINNNIYNCNIGNIGIGISNPQYKLDINDNINTKEILIKNTNISNIIDEKIIITSNKLIDYSNLINKPILSLISKTGDYNDLIIKPTNMEGTSNYNSLINKPWIILGNNIYNFNNGNIGIGISNPQYKLDINEDLNTKELFIKSINISNIIDEKIIITSNKLIDYNNFINKPNLS